MRTLWLLVFLVATDPTTAYDRFASPDGKFEAYTTAANDDGSEMKLYLRRAGSPDAGVLVRQNNRWIDAKWSPDSRFLAVIDHITLRIYAATM